MKLNLFFRRLFPLIPGDTTICGRDLASNSVAFHHQEENGPKYTLCPDEQATNLMLPGCKLRGRTRTQIKDLHKVSENKYNPTLSRLHRRRLQEQSGDIGLQVVCQDHVCQQNRLRFLSIFAIVGLS